MLWPDVQLESGISSRGGVHIQLVRMNHRVPPGLSKERPLRKRRQGQKVAWALSSQEVAGDGVCHGCDCLWIFIFIYEFYYIISSKRNPNIIFPVWPQTYRDPPGSAFPSAGLTAVYHSPPGSVSLKRFLVP